MARPRTFLLDGTALAYRAHFALATSRSGGLTTRTGHPTSATYGFTMTLRVILKREKPDRIAVAFDGPTEDLERTRIFPDYKATRAKAPDELKAQFADVREVVEGYGIRIIEEPKHEADDVIGTLALRCAEKGDEVYIVTSDKDFMQLVDDARIRLYDLKERGANEPKIVGPAEIEAKFGVRPEQIVDLLALMGDSSDNVPGVRGVGEKTAAALLKQFGSLDAVLAGTGEVKQPKLRQSLIDERDSALLSRDLVRIRHDLPLAVRPEDLGPAQPQPERLLATFERLEFKAFADEVRPLVAAAATVAETYDYRLAESVEECRAIAKRLETLPAFGLFALLEPRGPEGAELFALAVATRPGHAFYLPNRPGWLAALAPHLADPSKKKIGHNLKPGLGLLQRHGLAVAGLDFDAELASYCIAPGIRAHDLASLAQHYLSLRPTSLADVLGTGKKALQLGEILPQRLAEVACQAADFALRLRPPLEAELEAFAVGRLFRDLEMPLVPVLVGMEERGIKVDTGYMAELSAEMEARLVELTRRIEAAAGEPFNIGSPQQLGRVLFEKLEIHKATKQRPPKRTPTGQWSTDAAVLEKYAEHALVALVLEHRRLSKLKGTYVDALPLLVRPSTGRIHTSFNQAVAATGRLSSEDPNLQNIPIRTEDGRKLRRAFVPGEPGWVLLSADYSQIELRILAHVSGDESLRQGFVKGQDVHARTASIVFGVLPELVDARMRSQAKVINYGLVYGMGVHRVAQETGMSTAEARRFVDAYFRAMPRVKGWLDATLETARATGEVRTIFGRRRPIPELSGEVPPHIRVNAENVAVNSPIQGSAADIVKRAMLALDTAIAREGLQGRLLLQVHDELVVECPRQEAEKMAATVKRCMEGAAELAVPLEVEVGVGASWLEAH